MSDQDLELETALAAALAELKAARNKIAQLEALSDLSERLVDAGSFQMDWDTMQVRWSDNTFRMFGVSREEFGQNYTSVTDFIHPDDRASFAATMARVIATHEPYAHRHRIVRPNGEIRHVRVAAATVGGPEGKLFLGIIQDVTDLVETKGIARRSAEFARMAERVFLLGSWSFDVIRQEVTWSAETASIHDEPPGTSPRLDDAFNYYIPEHRACIRAAFDDCVKNGRPYDEVFQIVTAKGRNASIRTIGEPLRNATGQIVVIQARFRISRR